MSTAGRRIAASLAIALFAATVVPCPEIAAPIERPGREVASTHHGAGHAADGDAPHSAPSASHPNPTKRSDSHASHTSHSSSSSHSVHNAGHNGHDAHAGQARPVASSAESVPPAPTLFLDAPCPCGCADRAMPSSAVGRLAATVPSSAPTFDHTSITGTIETPVLALADAPLSAIDHIPDFA